MRQLVLVELNEINFDIVQRYLDAEPGAFPSLRRLVSSHGIRTTCEKKYELLEPWIQWVSVHTGRSFDEHRILRLGDITSSEIPQVFEELERAGIRVGAVSPMNAVNRLQSPAYFIPDPWTRTPSDSSWWSRVLAAAVSQAVNDNSKSRISPLSLLHLGLGIIRFAQLRNCLRYLRLALGARRSPWRKALFLDLFLHDLHFGLLRRRRPGFSAVFFNGGAHLQHHYLLNAAPLRAGSAVRNPDWYVDTSADPIVEMLHVYDSIVADYLDLPGTEVIVATGLSQLPYDRVKFYYRLRDHTAFLRLLGIKFNAVIPRMTRDFLIEFDCAADAAAAQHQLASIVDDRGVPLFGEIDNRGASLFVTLTYPDEVGPDVQMYWDGSNGGHRLLPHVVFVAVKNGMHQEVGFAFFSGGIAVHAPPDGAHVKLLHQCIMRFFAELHPA